ncbi:hypothetical protein SAMN05519103_06122 [Rhizobiales bacterium GAS113]|nr:hypothetical protein SAMN05519103_06122 [Rhizobiales bacterium GAS113]
MKVAILDDYQNVAVTGHLGLRLPIGEHQDLWGIKLQPARLRQRCRWPVRDTIARRGAEACRRGRACGFAAADAHRADRRVIASGTLPIVFIKRSSGSGTPKCSPIRAPYAPCSVIAAALVCPTEAISLQLPSPRTATSFGGQLRSCFSTAMLRQSGPAFFHDPIEIVGSDHEVMSASHTFVDRSAIGRRVSSMLCARRARLAVLVQRGVRAGRQRNQRDWALASQHTDCRRLSRKTGSVARHSRGEGGSI